MNKLNLREIQKSKGNRTLHMLTSYDYPSACLLNLTKVDMILVGDSLANVMLGFETTIPATLEMMTLFGKAVKKGAPNKFVIVDAPFGSYSTFQQGVNNLSKLYQNTQAEAIKLEGGSTFHFKLIDRLVKTGVPIMGHIGLQPQSVHAQGGYRKHGSHENEKNNLMKQAKLLEEAGAFSLVLECVDEQTAKEITQSISIPTIGIGSGKYTDGQVLVYHDLLGLSSTKAPQFVKPIANFFEEHKKIINKYLETEK